MVSEVAIRGRAVLLARSSWFVDAILADVVVSCEGESSCSGTEDDDEELDLILPRSRDFGRDSLLIDRRLIKGPDVEVFLTCAW